jgi:hypothetical protein
MSNAHVYFHLINLYFTIQKQRKHVITEMVYSYNQAYDSTRIL